MSILRGRPAGTLGDLSPAFWLCIQCSLHDAVVLAPLKWIPLYYVSQHPCSEQIGEGTLLTPPQKMESFSSPSLSQLPATPNPSPWPLTLLGGGEAHVGPG